MAVHNGAQHVRSAIQSLLGQTLRDLELIVVDDGSTDETVELVAAFDDPRLRLHRSDRNLGIPSALNVGLELARGEYIARADHDDISLPRRLEREVAALDAGARTAVVGTWFDVVDSEGRVLARPRGQIGDFVDFVSLLLIDRLPLHQPTSMFRRDVVLGLGGYDPLMRIGEDKDLWRRIALAGWSAHIVPEPLVRYRVHAGQQTQVNAQVGRELDALAQERFVTALGSAAPAHQIRLLLADRLEVWDLVSSAAAGSALAHDLERFTADAVTRLQLGEADAARLRRLLGARVARVASGAWRHGVNSQWRTTRPLWRYGATGSGGRPALTLAVRYASAVVAAPLLYATRGATRAGLGWLVDRPLLAAVRARAARSPRLRRIYAAVLRRHEETTKPPNRGSAGTGS